MSHPAATHMAEKRNGYWNVSRIEDRTHTTSGRDRGWAIITNAAGAARYLIRMEDGAMVARLVKEVPVQTQWGENLIQVTAKATLTHDELPTGGTVLLVGNRCGSLTWFGGTATYDGSNIDGGVIHKAYVSSQHRRKGLATALLRVARSRFPDKDIRHSNALSADGAAWAAATPTPNDLPTSRPAAEVAA